MNVENLPDSLKPVFERHSCRSFKSEAIPEEHIEILVESMRQAPSAGNRQPWHFYLVHNKDMQHKLADAAGGQHFIAQAPILFVICAIADQSAARYGERGRTLYVLQDTAAAVENLMVTAAGLGYGTCWIGAFDESAVSGAMDLPAEYRPVAMVPAGKAAKMPRALGRKEISDILTIIK